MTARLTLTAAGIAAIADGANVGLAAVTFTRLALGSGTGMGDQSARTALDTRQDIVAVTGSAPTPGRVAIRGDFAPSQAYAVTEVGLFARVGAMGAEFLCAYWIAESDADAVAAAASGTALVIAGIVEVVSAAADINIAPAVNIQIGAPANVVYQSQHATVDRRGIIELATLIEGRAGTDDERAITALVLTAILGGYGTRTWVLAEIAKIVDSAPQNLNTLNEIAAALNDNANIATTLNDAIAGRVRRAGDTMTGALNLVTPNAADDSKKAVNSEWVRDFGDGRYAHAGTTAYVVYSDRASINAMSTHYLLQVNLATGAISQIGTSLSGAFQGRMSLFLVGRSMYGLLVEAGSATGESNISFQLYSVDVSAGQPVNPFTAVGDAGSLAITNATKPLDDSIGVVVR